MSDLKREIAQNKPFSGPEEEALLNLLRTADCIERVMQHTTRQWGITSTQYNVLRILRGAHPEGLTCSSIGQRMITADPDVTRLVARLKALKLVRQQRDKRDRRIHWTHISDAGLALLQEMDGMVRKMPRTILGHLDPSDLNEFIRLLELARQHCADTREQVSCEGTNQAATPVSCDGTADAPSNRSCLPESGPGSGSENTKAAQVTRG